MSTYPSSAERRCVDRNCYMICWTQFLFRHRTVQIDSVLRCSSRLDERSRCRRCEWSLRRSILVRVWSVAKMVFANFVLASFVVQPNNQRRSAVRLSTETTTLDDVTFAVDRQILEFVILAWRVDAVDELAVRNRTIACQISWIFAQLQNHGFVPSLMEPNSADDHVAT